ncbi:uncharacterized protein LOC129596894 [Paramacrobiotus metropolitanus]|uniref:uncharacterized protein LOC129596894 n=1 Tax=Paramacrobiotus metropolitanus TaxID=2943436 RepID=UPI0024457213|nr:uncharacterized protein LOC129596894 [Paramacrobiotus metropolitanus]
MQLIIFAGLLVAADISMAADLGPSPPSECCSVRKYSIPTTPSESLPGNAASPWQYAVRVGQILYVTSLRAFASFTHRDTIFSVGNTNAEVTQIMMLINNILMEAGCTWSNVHDVEVLVTGDPDDKFPAVYKAMDRFCRALNCTDFPWAAHFRTAESLADNATVEFAVQASNCEWEHKASPQHKGLQSECCGPLKRYPVLSSLVESTESAPNPWKYAVRVGQNLHVSSVRAFKTLTDRTIISPGGAYTETKQIMTLTEEILSKAGCSWNNVHDVALLVTGGRENYPVIDKAINDFCGESAYNCSGFPWAAHLRSAPSLANQATVEIAVQASYCPWKPVDHE